MAQFIYGIHAVDALMSYHPERIIEVYRLKGRCDAKIERIMTALTELGISIQFASRQTLDRKVATTYHQGIVAKVKDMPDYDERALAELIIRCKQNNERILLLILDGVTDPHNLGACVRSANAAGVQAVIIPKNNAAELNHGARKVACGAAEITPVIKVTNLARTIKKLQDEQIWVVGTSGEAVKDIYRSTLTGDIALVMGAEGDGMRHLTKERCDELVKIPLHGSVSSLNVSVATGICLFEILRQNH